MTDQYITAQQLTTIIPLSHRHLAERITHRKDFPPATRVGAKRFWKRAEVVAWLESRVGK